MMMKTFLSTQEMQENLHNYYKQHYGERKADKIVESMANNIFMFEREGKVIGLKCHISTGEVEVLP